jgi:cytolysin (calcineurin-like family phosphatase)
LVEKYNAKGFVLVTINIAPDDKAGQLMMSKQKYGFVNLQAPDSEWASKTYDRHRFPTTYVLDADGKAIFMHVGYSPQAIEEMDAEIAALLSMKATKN